MLSAVRLAHPEDQVLQTRSLRRWPMDTIDDYLGRNSSRIKYEIADLPIKYNDGKEAQCSCGISCVTGLILVAVD